MKIGTLHIANREIVLHAIFWMIWVLSFTFIQTLNEGGETFSVWLMYYIITLPVFVSHTYLIAYWLLPITFFRGRYFLFAAGIGALLLIFSVIELVCSNYLIFGIFDQARMFEPGYLNLKNIVISGIGNHYIILVFLAIKAGGSWYRAESEKEELLLSKVETELETYRYQMQPKMVKSLIEDLDLITLEQPDNAPQMIINISDFLNVFLFEGNEELIPLHHEVKLLEGFMEIHKQALGKKIISNFVVSGNLKSHVIPPLLLLPFINSSIKMVYGCNNSFESTVIIKAEKKYLLFSFSLWSEENFKQADIGSIETIRKRLKYNFHGKHRLVENVDDNFTELSLEIFD